MIAWITKIPWAWHAIGGFGIGWLGGWPGEEEDEGTSIISTLFNVALLVVGGIVGVMAIRKLAD